MLQGLEALDAPDDVLHEALQGMAAARDIETFGVWQDNWPVFELFAHRLAGQWRYLALPMDAPVRLGLDYAAVEAALRMSGMRKRARGRTFTLLCEMEAAVLAVDAARRDKLDGERGGWPQER
ncbi:MAG: DUF1799 domain-containing protein [Janthinobacterium lividum]